MSLRVTYQFVCDFCGTEIFPADTKVLSTGIHLINSGGIPLPTWFHAARSCLAAGQIDAHLCGPCMAPGLAAQQKRLNELREQGKLTGFPSA